MWLILTFIIFIYSIIIHEITHGLVAEKLGDPTARLQKRLTLNPIPHIDPIMSVFLPMILIISGSPIILGAAKPVPIDPYNLKNPRRDMGIIGLAGPLSNISLAVIFSIIARLVLAFSPDPNILQVLATAATLNILLAIFNLIPVPPLDGGRLLTGILPEKYAEALASIERFGIMIVLFLLLFPSSFFSLQKVVLQITFLIFSLIFPRLPLI